MVSLTPQKLYLWGKSTRCPLNGRLEGLRTSLEMSLVPDMDLQIFQSIAKSLYRCSQLPSRRVEFLKPVEQTSVLQQILPCSVSSLRYEAQVGGSLLSNVPTRNRQPRLTVNFTPESCVYYEIYLICFIQESHISTSTACCHLTFVSY